MKGRDMFALPHCTPWWTSPATTGHRPLMGAAGAQGSAGRQALIQFCLSVLSTPHRKEAIRMSECVKS